jgi:hypothetical protein
MAFEELDRPLVFLGLLTSLKGAKVSPPAGPGIFFARIKPKLARWKLANHKHSFLCFYYRALGAKKLPSH